jgi:hypothetical protein
MPLLYITRKLLASMRTTLGGHAFWRFDDPTRPSQQQVHFDKNLAILDGLVLAAVLDTPDTRRRRRWSRY